MPDLTDEQREQAVREVFRAFPDAKGPTVPDVQALLRLLDAERARADAAEARVGRCNCQREGYDAYGRNVKDRLAFLASEPE